MDARRGNAVVEQARVGEQELARAGEHHNVAQRSNVAVDGAHQRVAVLGATRPQYADLAHAVRGKQGIVGLEFVHARIAQGYVHPRRHQDEMRGLLEAKRIEALGKAHGESATRAVTHERNVAGTVLLGHQAIHRLNRGVCVCVRVHGRKRIHGHEDLGARPACDGIGELPLIYGRPVEEVAPVQEDDGAVVAIPAIEQEGLDSRHVDALHGSLEGHQLGHAHGLLVGNRLLEYVVVKRNRVGELLAVGGKAEVDLGRCAHVRAMEHPVRYGRERKPSGNGCRYRDSGDGERGALVQECGDGHDLLLVVLPWRA